MKQLILMLIVVAVANSHADAQKIRFTDSSNVWSVLSRCDCGTDIYHETFRYGADSIINGLHYRFLSDDHSGYSDPPLGWVREDTAIGKVFFKGFRYMGTGGTVDTLERTLYDYNLVQGDTIRVDFGTYHYVHFIQHLNTVTINGIYHKVWDITPVHKTGLGPGKSYTIIEGIGSTDDPLFPANPYFFESYQEIYCFRQGSVWPRLSKTLSGNRIVFDNSCTLAVGRANAAEAVRSNIVVPTPAHAGAEIRLAARMASGTLKLYNSSGTMIALMAVSNATAIPLPQSVSLPGVYFYSITDMQSGKVLQGQFSYE